jgi:hypothetical protein
MTIKVGSTAPPDTCSQSGWGTLDAKRYSTTIGLFSKAYDHLKGRQSILMAMRLWHMTRDERFFTRM